jgi:ribosomal protein L11 methyltransferase
MSPPPGAPERWLVLAVRTPPDPDAAALLTDALLGLGGRAVWEEAGRLVTHLREPDDPDAFTRDAQARLRAATALPELALESSWQPHEEWAETWKRGLAPRRLTPRLIVTPSWESPEAGPDDVVIRLDPGMAFGNAEHGTTRGCLRLLDRVLRPGERVLDVGTGSGVLSIAAARLGASAVLGLEGDASACEVALENLARNGVRERVTVRECWADAEQLAALGTFDGVIANIEAATLGPLLPGLGACVRAGGWVILSGLLAPDCEPLLDLATSHHLSQAAVDEDGEWRSLLLRRSR